MSAGDGVSEPNDDITEEDILNRYRLERQQFFHYFLFKIINLHSFYIFIERCFVFKHAINNMN
jgi:hypothetical protein